MMERVYLKQEPVDIEPAWRELTNLAERSAKGWQDVYLAVFALQSNLRIASPSIEDSGPILICL